MTYNIFDNRGDLNEHFQFVRIDDEKISLKYIDNEFIRNRRLSMRFNYYELKPIVDDYNWRVNYINKNVELVLGVSFYTGVELKRELKFNCEYEGIIVDFFEGTHMCHEDILIIDTSLDTINDYINIIEDDLVNEINGRREPIPQDVQDRVWNRDGGRCVKCGSNIKLEFDHIIPFSKGGANTYRNLQLLCEKCNRKKSNKIG